MLTHIKIYHSGEIAKDKCNQCGKLFGSKQSLEQHEIIHRGLAVLKEGQSTDPEHYRKRLQLGLFQGRGRVNLFPSQLLQN